MKKTIKNFIITVASLTALLLLFSCAMENNELKTADLEISVQSLNSKTLTPEGGLDSTKITKYKLNGVGPRGATFDWMESSDGKFKVTGIIQGAWTLSAEGYTANNTEIAIGKTVVNLSAGNTKTIVVLNELVGKGTANITVTWDTSMASDKAFVEMRVKPVGATYVTKTFKSQTNGNAVYNELLDAGSYIVNALLYEDNTKTKLIAGTADAMRIVDNKITNGNLALVIGNIATDYDFTLNDQTMAPIEGTLTTVVADPDAEHKSVVNATYTLSQDTLTIMNGLGVKTSDINVEWFLDGVSVTDENTADDKFKGTFTVTAGERNLGIVLTSARLGSSGNSNILVNALYIPDTKIIVKAGNTVTQEEIGFPKDLDESKVFIGYIAKDVESKTIDTQNLDNFVFFPYTANVTDKELIPYYKSSEDLFVLNNYPDGRKIIVNILNPSWLKTLTNNGAKKISLSIPSNVFRFSSPSIPNWCNNVYVPSGLESLPIKNSSDGNSVLYTISPQNKLYLSENGIIYNKEKTELIYFPNTKEKTNFIIPNSVIRIKDNAFENCYNLLSITFPNNITEIGAFAFSGCSSLNNVKIPGKINTIAAYTFAKCTNLTNVDILEGITDIDANAFFECDNLSQIFLPNSLNNNMPKVNFFMLSSFPKLKAINIKDDNIEYSSQDGVLYNKDKTVLLKYPQGKTENKFTIPNSVTTISENAFADCTALSSITIPNSVTAISSVAFYAWKDTQTIYIRASSKPAGWKADWNSGCNAKIVWGVPNLAPNETLSNLDSVGFAPAGKFIVGYTPVLADINDYKKSISLPYTNNTSSYQTFYPIYMDQNTFVTTTNGSIVIKDAYKDVKLVVMPESGVTTIGDGAFSGCTALSSVTIGNSVTTIGSNAFYDCPSLSSVTIGNSVTTISDGAFSDCTALSSITIPNSVTTISDGAFSGCTALSSITIPNSVTTISDGAFFGCTALSSITIPNSVTTISDGAFFGCTALSSINVDFNNPNYSSLDGNLYNKNKTTLVQYALGKTATNFTIPNSVTTISDGAFFCCTALSSITIPNSVTTISDGAFSDCTALSSITIPNSVTTISDGAFSGCTALSSITIPNSVTTIGSSVFYAWKNTQTINIEAISNPSEWSSDWDYDCSANIVWGYTSK